MFVSSYPMGTGEAFIENELRHTFKFWNKIYLIRNNDEKGEQRYTSLNCRPMAINEVNRRDNNYVLLRNVRIISHILLLEFLHSRQRTLFLSGFKKHLGLLVAALRMAEHLKQLIEVVPRNYFYSYWFNEWNLTLSILKYQKVIDKNFTRAHGFDLYENNGKPNYLPFRYFCLKHTDKVLTVSKAGAVFLWERYPKFHKKIKTSYLGTEDYGIGPQCSDPNTITVVSCGSLVEVKRPRLIINILKECSKKVKWVHIGEGPLQAELQRDCLILPNNVTIHFMGKLSQSSLFCFYKENFVDCFLNTSISEGLPVSIMEAISFGIPVIATDVGGTAEIVKDGITGELIAIDFDPKSVAKLIENVTKSFADKRGKIREFWLDHFQAKKNYAEFVQELTL